MNKIIIITIRINVSRVIRDCNSCEENWIHQLFTSILFPSIQIILNYLFFLLPFSRNLNKFQDTRYKFYYYIIVCQIKYLIKSLSTKLKIQVKFFFQVIRRRSIRYHSFKHNLDYSSRHSAISTCFSISKKNFSILLNREIFKKKKIILSILSSTAL